MKKRTLILLILALFPILLSGQTGIDALFSKFELATGGQKNDIGQELIDRFLQDDLYDYPINRRQRSDKDFSNMLVHLGMANRLYDQSDFRGSVHQAKKALSYAPKDSLRWLSSCYEIANVALQRNGDFTKALDYAKKDLAIGEQLNDSRIQSSALNSLASIHLYTEHPDNALKFINKAINIERENPQPGNKSLAIRLGMKSEVLMSLKRPEEAIVCIDEALKLDSAANRINKVGIRLSQKADILLYQKEWDECRKTCLAALEIFKENKSTVDMIITLKQLGMCELQSKHYNNSEKYLLEGERLCKETGFRPLEWRIQNTLYQLYKEVGDYSKAMRYLEVSAATKDSLRNMEYEKLASEYQVAYETQQKEEQLEAQQQTIHNRTMLTIILIVLLVMALALSITAFALARVRKNHNQYLTEMGRTRDQIFSIVSHDLKNPVSAQKLVLDYMCKHYDETSDADKKKQLEALRDSNDSLSNLLIDLLEWASLESGRFTYNPIRTDLSSAVNTCLRSIQPYIEKKKITIVQDIPQNTFVLADINILETILRNLITNAVKFSYVEGQVEITATETNEHVNVNVIDHGIGMRPEEKTLIFNKEKITTPGTSGELGTGVGLMVCKELIDKSQSKISFTSEHLKGSTFTLTLPRLT